MSNIVWPICDTAVVVWQYFIRLKAYRRYLNSLLHIHLPIAIGILFIVIRLYRLVTSGVMPVWMMPTELILSLSPFLLAYGVGRILALGNFGPIRNDITELLMIQERLRREKSKWPKVSKALGKEASILTELIPAFLESAYYVEKAGYKGHPSYNNVRSCKTDRIIIQAEGNYDSDDLLVIEVKKSILEHGKTLAFSLNFGRV